MYDFICYKNTLSILKTIDTIIEAKPTPITILLYYFIYSLLLLYYLYF